MFKLYNTLSRKAEEIRPSDGKMVKIYNCGPTVYDFAHIGNLRTFTLQDLLRKYIEFKGFKVKLVMNVTDVDDKTIKGAQAKGVPLGEFTAKYAKEFFNDAEALGIKKPDVTAFATKEIHEMVKIIQGLLDKKIAYKSPDGSVYFSIKKFKEYGKLSRLKIRRLKAGARVDSDSYEKDQANDFVLWKAWQEPDGSVFWDSPFGKGRPGWHIECSAMSLKYLGNQIDIHGGGVDLVFPHHENEFAQSSAFTGKPVIRHWVHCNHLVVGGRKMSKSLGNFYTLRDLEKHDKRAIRLLFISANYRDELNFTFESLKQAENVVNGFDESVKRLLDANGTSNADTEKIVSNARKEFEKNMDADLDTPRMLAGLHAFFKQANRLVDEKKIGEKQAKEILAFLREINSVLGIFRFQFDETISQEEKELIEKREKLRKEKKFKEADEIRQLLLKEKKLRLDDTDKGVKWKRIG